VLASGKSGPGAKYWTSSCMYLPEGRVMPAYSTWQPTDGSSHPIASAAQAAQRRLYRRDDPVRWDPIVSTLLGEIGGRS
jgi:hypothetical protein